MLYSVLSKCCAGNYKKRRILRCVVSLPRLSKAEAPPTIRTRSHCYAAFPELLDYFFLCAFDRLMTLCLGSGPPAVSFQTCFSQVGTYGQREWCLPDRYSHTDAVDPSRLYTASLCVPILLVWGFFISVTDVEIHHTIGVTDNVLFTVQNFVRNYKPTHSSHAH